MKSKSQIDSTKMKIVIAVSGYARAGKDTFADALQDAIGQNASVKRFKFAEPLRVSVKHAFEYLKIKTSPWTEVEEDKNKMRPVFIALGEYARSTDKNIFAKLAAYETDYSLNNGCDIAIITDLRYSNENKTLRELCLKKGYRYHRVHIVRVGNKPAGTVEKRSVALLLKDGLDIQYVANDGDLHMIKKFANECVEILGDDIRVSLPRDAT